ncbi:hypothetical protein [Microbispora sp. NPDC049125]|uniref:hypothetical protein n=1 Tax=Microbispora sp. NPDC049125 TaxID=3154929 RepID=UPI003465F5A1
MRATTIRADAVIMPDGTPGLTDAAASAAGAESSLFTGLFEPDGGALSAIGTTPELLARAGDVQVVSGSLDALRSKDRVLGTVAAESALVVPLGTGLGLVVALPALLGMRRAFATAMRADVPLVVPWPLILGVIAVCLALAAGAAVLAARPAVRGAARS